jgi:uncharacterized membrane protein YqjE
MGRRSQDGKRRGGRRQDSWLDLFRELGQALLEVLRAELTVVWEHWRIWGRNWIVAAVLFVVVLFLTFWLSGLLVVALVHGVMAAFDLALWQAALSTAAALLLVMAVLAGGGLWLAKRSESPMETVRRQLDDHRAWLDGKILGERELRPAGKRLAKGDDDGGTEQADSTGDGAAAGPPAAS